jgi:hypothetical protein
LALWINARWQEWLRMVGKGVTDPREVRWHDVPDYAATFDMGIAGGASRVLTGTRRRATSRARL